MFQMSVKSLNSLIVADILWQTIPQAIIPHWKFGHHRSQDVFSAVPAAMSLLSSTTVYGGCWQHSEGHQRGTEAQGHVMTYMSLSPTWTRRARGHAANGDWPQIGQCFGFV